MDRELKERLARARLDAGLERLRQGKTAPAAVCREVLLLGGQPSHEEVVKALHDGIHNLKDLDRDDARRIQGRALVTSAYVLLRGFESS